MIKSLKRNKFFLVVSILLAILTCYSFYDVYKTYFPSKTWYNKVKLYCYDKKDPTHEYCQRFLTEENMRKYIETHDPVKEFEAKKKEYDAITLTSTVVELTAFNLLQYLSPLIIAIAVIGSIHAEFSSGMFFNYLLEMPYKKYLKKTYKIAIKSALIIPITLIMVFLISYVLSGFNINQANINKSLAVYSDFKYSNFFIYGSLIILIQFFISLLYSNISLYCLKKSNNKLVAIIMSYIIFLLTHMFIYLIVYVVIINKVLGFKELTDYFSITGFWFFESKKDCLFVLLISFIIQLVSLIILYSSYKNKEKVIKEYEKQTS